MSENRRSKRVRVVGLVAIALVALGLVATDDGTLPVMAKCFALGEGRAWVPEQPQDFEADFFGYVYEGNTGNLIDMQVFAFGAYEKPILFALRDALKVKAKGEGGVAVDVGANVGHHSMFLSLHAETVHAIEPFPPVLERLRGALETNGITNVVVHPVGYSSEAGTLPFHPPPEDNHGSGSFSAEHLDANRPVQQLPLVRGDDDLQGIARVDLIKMDIEGYERFGFQGLEATMKRDRPVVVFELNVHTDGGFRSRDELEGTFPEGYRFFEIRQRPDVRWRLPGGQLMCGRAQGHYELVPYDMTFEVSSINLLGAPPEVAEALSE